MHSGDLTMSERSVSYAANHIPRHPLRLEGGVRTRGLFEKRSVPGHPLVSVITVVRNGERHLEETILSVLNQTYDNVEFLVVDGASEDGTLDIVRKYENRVAYWISEPDRGVYEAINKGLALMSGLCWAYLSADDLYTPTAVEAAVDAFESNEECGVVYGDLQMISEDGRYLSLYRYPEFDNKRFRLNVNPCQHGHVSTFLRTAVYQIIGGFSTKYKYAGDYEYFLRAAKKGIRMLHEPRIVAQMRMHRGQISERCRREHWQEHLSIYQDYFGEPRLNAWSFYDNARRFTRNVRYYWKRIWVYR